MSGEEETRISVNLNETLDDLHWLVNVLGGSKTEHVKSAIRWYRHCREAASTEAGGEVRIRRTENEELTRVWFT